MAITVKHTKVSTIPDAGDASLIEPSDWNADHQLVGTVPVANGGTGASTLTGYVVGNGTSAMTAATTIPSTDVTGLGTMSTQNSNNISVTGGSISGVTVSGYIPTSAEGVANGVATLDSGGQIPLSQIPPLGDLNYQGTWNATTNTPTLTSSTGTKGYYYVVSVAGTTNLNGITDWQISDWAVFNGSVWQKIDNTDLVTSVNGYTGTVVLTAADVSAVPYTGATGAVDLNAKSLTNVSNLGINTTTVPTIKIRAVGDNNSGSRIAMRGYSSDANSSSIRVSKYRGTVASPQAPLSGDSLGKFELAGYGTTSSDSYPQSSLEGVATENWGATARGAKAVVKVTPNTTTTQVTALTINQDSTAVFASTVTANGTLLTGNTGTVTSVAATAGTGISISGSPITTSGTLTVTNTAPDQTVVLTAGTGISTSGTYPNFTITNTSPSSGGTVTSVTGTSPVVSSGGNTPAISMPAATTSVSGYLTSTDWNTFNGKSNTNGTVTSVAALTLGTTGTDLSSTVATGTTTPVITLQVPTASASNRGALSSTDWSTFNGKQASLVSGTNIKTVAGVSLLGSGDVGLIGGTYGGTGVNNGASTITVGGNVNYSGAYTQTWTRTANTSLTLPVSGTVLSSVTAPATNPISGTPSSSNYLRGDGTWSAVSVSAAGSNTQIQYNNSGAFGASSSFTFDGTTNTSPVQAASNGFFVNPNTNTSSYTIPSGSNAVTAGKFTVATSTTITVSTGSRWVVV